MKDFLTIFHGVISCDQNDHFWSFQDKLVLSIYSLYTFVTLILLMKALTATIWLA